MHLSAPSIHEAGQRRPLAYRGRSDSNYFFDQGYEAREYRRSLMLKTRFCELFGIEYPIVCAGMGGVALASLAAAVSDAGGLGTIALAGFSADGIHDQISAARKITTKPIVVNLLIPFLRPGTFEAQKRDQQV